MTMTMMMMTITHFFESRPEIHVSVAHSRFILCPSPPVSFLIAPPFLLTGPIKLEPLLLCAFLGADLVAPACGQERGAIGRFEAS